MTNQTTIVLVPGAFGVPSFYSSIIDPIAASGQDIRALHLPSVSSSGDGVPGTMYDDAAFIAKEVEKLADEGRHVVLIPHSYGGVPATESTKGLSKEERKKQGKKGGVVRLAYMTCIVPAVGGSAGSTMASVPEEYNLHLGIDDKGWMYHTDASLSASICFSDLPKEDGEALIKSFGRHSAASFPSKLTHPGYKDIPVSYLFCEEDLCIPAKIQQEEIDMIESVSGNKVDVTSIKAGHIPNASQPQVVIDWFLDVAKKV